MLRWKKTNFITSSSLVDVRPSSKFFSLRLTYSNITFFLVNLIKVDCFLIIMDLQSTTVENSSWLQCTTMELLLYLMTEWLVSVIKGVLSTSYLMLLVVEKMSGYYDFLVIQRFAQICFDKIEGGSYPPKINVFTYQGYPCSKNFPFYTPPLSIVPPHALMRKHKSPPQNFVSILQTMSNNGRKKIFFVSAACTRPIQ